MNFKASFVAFKTIAGKELRRIFRIWPQTLMPPAVTTILYFVIFGNVIGRRVGDMAGHDYINYIAPGLVMLSVITSSYASTSSAFYMARFQRSIEEILVSPISNVLILLGYACGGLIRGITVGSLVAVIALFFTHISVQHYGIAILVLFIASAIFSIAGIINGIYAKSFDDISIIPTFVLTPLTYLAGVFYSIELLPNFWHKISLIDPIYYIVNAFRFAFLGGDAPYLWVSFILLFAFFLILFTLAAYLFHKGVGIRE